MATEKKRQIFYSDPEIDNWLRNEAFRLRVSQGFLIRSAVRLLMAGGQQVKRGPSPAELEIVDAAFKQAAKVTSRQPACNIPVLITKK